MIANKTVHEYDFLACPWHLAVPRMEIGKWYHVDETKTPHAGPFDSREEARDELPENGELHVHRCRPNQHPARFSGCP